VGPQNPFFDTIFLPVLLPIRVAIMRSVIAKMNALCAFILYPYLSRFTARIAPVL
jgi:hypothetical protein